MYNDARHSQDHGPYPFVSNIGWEAWQNQNFRTAFWTGKHLQMTLMSIPPRSEIGPEMHKDTDQHIRVEQGQALVMMGNYQNCMDFQQYLCVGDAVFVPAGTWHNILNRGNSDLKLSSIYAPPNHPSGIVQQTKAEADREGY